MLVFVGLLVVLVGVFGGYMAAGGSMGVIFHALPFELSMIGGATAGAFIIGGSKHSLKHVLGGFKMAVKGERWHKEDYLNLLALLFVLSKLIKTKGVVAVESHIERPDDSEIFRQYPRILGDHFAVNLICDSIRMLTMDLSDVMVFEETLDKQIDKHYNEEMHASHGLQTMSDGLPALGIVAAVLGVIKTMSHISDPPEVLGKMIGGALVGTFLGVFLSYAMVGPIATRVAEVVNSDIQFYRVIKEVLVSHLRNAAPQVSVELGRVVIPTHDQPSFAQLEEMLNNLPSVTA